MRDILGSLDRPRNKQLRSKEVITERMIYQVLVELLTMPGRCGGGLSSGLTCVWVLKNGWAFARQRTRAENIPGKVTK